ncbi:Fc receptor 5 [Labeo rohita]|uniref:Fc receptor 5 n=1 Tax=Labeo rohita TaxID=84645 RepID=A0A498P0X5_LABRO|nr:Fc receptor 5 [Labeo rohita]
MRRIRQWVCDIIAKGANRVLRDKKNDSLKPKPELTSDPAGAALTGNTVTFTCRMDPSTGWDFYWYKHTLNPEIKTETNSYRVKIDSVSDGGQYWCRAGRGTPVYYTQYSDALWVNVTDQQRNINQTSDPNQSAESQTENSPLQSAGSDHIYDVVTEMNKRDKDDPKPLADITYSEVTVKKKKDKGKSSESGDTFYSELKHNTDRGADAGDATYAQPIRKKNKTRIASSSSPTSLSTKINSSISLLLRKLQGSEFL